MAKITAVIAIMSFLTDDIDKVGKGSTATTEAKVEPTEDPSVNYGAIYLGCFRERSINDRLFKGDFQNFTSTNTPDYCMENCRSKGFDFAGVQFGKQCFCTNERPSFEWHARNESQCRMPCSGDPVQVCGAHMKMNVYSLVDAKPGSLALSYVGCHPGGALSEEVTSGSALTLDTCKQRCEMSNYRYFGAENGSLCFCGNNTHTERVSELQCRVPCHGDTRQLCGGPSHLSLYRTSVQDEMKVDNEITAATEAKGEPTEDPFDEMKVGEEMTSTTEAKEEPTEVPIGSLALSYVGCHPERALSEEATTGSALTLDICKQRCEMSNYRYFGAENGYLCFCGNNIITERADELQCRVPCHGDTRQLCGGPSHLSLYRTSVPDDIGKVGEEFTATTEAKVEPTEDPIVNYGAIYLGCFRERSINDRLFKGDFQNFTSTNAPEFCMENCRSKRFDFAGVQFGKQCFCSNERPSFEWLARNESQCRMPCSGDPGQVCGAHMRMNVYSLVDAKPGSLALSYVGCYPEGALSEEVTTGSEPLTLDACKKRCEMNNYRYFGAENGSRCFCGNNIHTERVSEQECRVPCQGDTRQLCGGPFRLSVYRSSAPGL